MSLSTEALDRFGQLLMAQVRDLTIDQWKTIIDGRMKGDRALQLGQRLSQLSDKDREVFMSLVPEIVDNAIHNVLFMFEQEDDLTLAVTLNDRDVVDLRKESDGLCGELYTEDGWIARFSSE